MSDYSNRRDGERDFEHGGRLGYDLRPYNGWRRDDAAYRDGFDAARHQEDRRQEVLAERREEARREAYYETMDMRERDPEPEQEAEPEDVLVEAIHLAQDQSELMDKLQDY